MSVNPTRGRSQWGAGSRTQMKPLCGDAAKSLASACETVSTVNAPRSGGATGVGVNERERLDASIQDVGVYVDVPSWVFSLRVQPASSRPVPGLVGVARASVVAMLNRPIIACGPA